MKLTLEGIRERKAWENAGIRLPGYEIETMRRRTKEHPVWVHLGAGNIFRIFIGGLADSLIESGDMDRGILCAETFDFDIIDRIYAPHDNLVLAVTLHADGSMDKKVFGSLAEAMKVSQEDQKQWERMKAVFADPGLQLVSFTITEKGYGLRDSGGKYLSFVQADMENGPDKAVGAMAAVCAMLYERYRTCARPLALVSMDNCSHNGEKLKSAVLTVAAEWEKRGFVDAGFLAYLDDEEKVSFPWTMIDKITPRPSDAVAEMLQDSGVEDMETVITSKNTYIAPFVNAEEPQYLVVEDRFPNGRPPLEKAGVYMTDRETVNQTERMKVTTCLNPLHTALAVYGCLLGYDKISDEMKDKQLSKLVYQIGPVEGMPVVTDPGILSPEAFVEEVLSVRIPNPFMPDTPQRIATDTSQKVGIRYGETIKAYVKQYGDAKRLKAIPLAIAGWCRYLLAVDDEGKAFTLSSDPLISELTEALKGIVLGKIDSYNGQLRPILSSSNIFGIDLYEAGIGEMVEAMFVEEIAGPGAVRKTLLKYVGE